MIPDTYYYKVLIPNELLKSPVECNLYGRYISSTGIFNIISNKKQPGLKRIGSIGDSEEKKLKGIVKEGNLSFEYRGKECAIKGYGTYQDIYSRNSGILESNLLFKKTAIIIGCGSVGSQVALELARSGVGRFVLIDSDILEYHNLCRHQCGMEDVGRYKVDALKDRIRNICRDISVMVFRTSFENIPTRRLDEICNPDAIIIGCGDSRASDKYSNMVASGYGIPFISIGFWERAVVGEVFYWLPRKNMPCYSCAIGSNTELSERVDVNNHHIYTNETDLTKVHFEPGISVDISFVTCVGIKIALDILGKDIGYTPRVINDLTQYTLICNSNNPKLGGEGVEIFTYPLQITRSLMVDFKPLCPGTCRWESDD